MRAEILRSSQTKKMAERSIKVMSRNAAISAVTIWARGSPRKRASRVSTVRGPQADGENALGSPVNGRYSMRANRHRQEFFAPLWRSTRKVHHAHVPYVVA